MPPFVTDAFCILDVDVDAEIGKGRRYCLPGKQATDMLRTWNYVDFARNKDLNTRRVMQSRQTENNKQGTYFA